MAFIHHFIGSFSLEGHFASGFIWSPYLLNLFKYLESVEWTLLKFTSFKFLFGVWSFELPSFASGVVEPVLLWECWFGTSEF